MNGQGLLKVIDALGVTLAGLEAEVERLTIENASLKSEPAPSVSQPT